MAFQDAIRAATELKSKQLKARLGRQAWEQAPDFFKLTARCDDDVVALRSCALAQRMQAAHELREQGSRLAREALEDDAHIKALELYMRALSIFVWFDRGPDRASEDIPLVDGTSCLEDPQQAEHARQLCAVLLNNSATCLLRLERHADAVYAASKALEFDPYSARALYRRAIAKQKQQGTTELEEAVKDLRDAQSLEPSNAQVRTCLAAFQAELLEQKRKERAMFQGALKGGGLYSAEHAGQDSGEAEIAPLGRNRHVPDTEVAGYVRDMQKGMQRAQAAQTVREYPPQPGLFNFPRLPWWAWLIIAAHLVYRITKIFGSRPPKAGSSTEAVQGDEL